MSELVTSKTSLLEEFNRFIADFISYFDLRGSDSGEPFLMIDGWMLNVGRRDWTLSKRYGGRFIEISDRKQDIKHVTLFLKSVKWANGWPERLYKLNRRCQKNQIRLRKLRALFLSGVRATLHEEGGGQIVLKINANRPAYHRMIFDVSKKLKGIKYAAGHDCPRENGMWVNFAVEDEGTCLTLVIKSSTPALIPAKARNHASKKMAASRA